MSSEVNATLAAQINEALAESNRLAASAVEEAARAGKLMIEAKKQVPHGQWSQWIRHNCNMTDRNARRYMQLARELPKLEQAHRAEIMTLPIREAVQVIAEKKPTNSDDSVQNGHAVSVLADKNRLTEQQAPDRAAPSMQAETLWQRIFSLISDPTKNLLRSIWQLLVKKSRGEQAIVANSEH